MIMLIVQKKKYLTKSNTHMPIHDKKKKSLQIKYIEELPQIISEYTKFVGYYIG